MKIAIILLTFCIVDVAYTQNENKKRYIKIPTGYLMVLLQGDKVFEHLEKLASEEKIPSANFMGMGFVNAKFGFYDFKKKEYKPKEFKDVELGSFNGSLAWQDGKPSIHAHGVVTDKNFKAYGGHMLEAEVGTGSLEIMVVVHDKNLQRLKDEKLGANILSLEDGTKPLKK